jgi:hypothetical protein
MQQHRWWADTVWPGSRVPTLHRTCCQIARRHSPDMNSTAQRSLFYSRISDPPIWNALAVGDKWRAVAEEQLCVAGLRRMECHVSAKSPQSLEDSPIHDHSDTELGVFQKSRFQIRAWTLTILTEMYGFLVSFSRTVPATAKLMSATLGLVSATAVAGHTRVRVGHSCCRPHSGWCRPHSCWCRPQLLPATLGLVSATAVAGHTRVRVGHSCCRPHSGWCRQQTGWCRPQSVRCTSFRIR